MRSAVKEQGPSLTLFALHTLLYEALSNHVITFLCVCGSRKKKKYEKKNFRHPVNHHKVNNLLCRDDCPPAEGIFKVNAQVSNQSSPISLSYARLNFCVFFFKFLIQTH